MAARGFRFRGHSRVLEVFRSAGNTAYLASVFEAQIGDAALRRFVLDTLNDAVRDFEGDAAAGAAAAGAAQLPGATLWGEVSRLNREFFDSRMQFVREKTALISGRDEAGEDESYHFRMLTADSLQPAGLQGLNSSPRSDELSTAPDPLDPGVFADDWGWDKGDADRTAEQALAECWGEDLVASSALGLAYDRAGTIARRDRFGQGGGWGENGGARPMRFMAPPRWQHTPGAVATIDRDIDGTLGTDGREHGSHVRKWSGLDPKKKRGESYMRFMHD
jgi:hypothetical protein